VRVTRPSSKLGALLARARNAASPFGKKSDLARFLGEPRQRVNDWLSGARAPGGEVTLLILDWVQGEEAKQKESPGCAGARPEPKTQLRKSKNEKPKSGPRKACRK
jgi:hypothetical protein